MRSRSVLAFSLSFVLAAAVLAQAADPGKGKGGSKASGKSPIVWPAANLKWEEPPEATGGVKVVGLWGDRTKGAFGDLQKFPAGFSVPLHTHSADFKVVVVSGTLIHGSEGKPDVKLPAGSYLYLPSTYRHTTGCDKASECVLFVEGNRKFDVKPVDAGKAPAKK